MNFPNNVLMAPEKSSPLSSSVAFRLFLILECICEKYIFRVGFRRSLRLVIANNPDTKGAAAKKAAFRHFRHFRRKRKRMKDSSLSPFPEGVTKQNQDLCFLRLRGVYRQKQSPSGGPVSGNPTERLSCLYPTYTLVQPLSRATMPSVLAPTESNASDTPFLQVNSQGNLTKGVRFGDRTFRCSPADASQLHQIPGTYSHKRTHISSGGTHVP